VINQLVRLLSRYEQRGLVDSGAVRCTELGADSVDRHLIHQAMLSGSTPIRGFLYQVTGREVGCCEVARSAA
jgi:hypothetical protein